jgi:hypothetical protein
MHWRSEVSRRRAPGYRRSMGDPAAINDVSDVQAMMLRLEELQRERERVDAQIEALAREDDALLARIRGCREERERIERRKLEIEGELPEIDARRDALEDEQQALVSRRDAYDAEYTDLYARLDKSVDEVEPAPTPALAAVSADRFTAVGPASVPLARPAPWRTTLIVVPDPDAPPAVAPAKAARWWTATHGMIAFAVVLVMLVIGGAIAAWPDDPPPTPSIDPKQGLEMVRAALVPASAEPAPVAAAPAPIPEPAVAPAEPAKRRAKAKRSRRDATKAKSAKSTKNERP